MSIPGDMILGETKCSDSFSHLSQLASWKGHQEGETWVKVQYLVMCKCCSIPAFPVLFFKQVVKAHHHGHVHLQAFLQICLEMLAQFPSIEGQVLQEKLPWRFCPFPSAYSIKALWEKCKRVLWIYMFVKISWSARKGGPQALARILSRIKWHWFLRMGQFKKIHSILLFHDFQSRISE